MTVIRFKWYRRIRSPDERSVFMISRTSRPHLNREQNRVLSTSDNWEKIREKLLNSYIEKHELPDNVHINLIRSHFEKHQAWRTVRRKIIAFWGTTRSSTSTLYDALVYERKSKSEYLEGQIYERLLKSEPFIVKLIENQSEHLSEISDLS